ncbi:hypothetical protein [Pseudolysinimonas yzui]|uniref:Uncharacterized protein n=1 Tax=Pseudolysinimonas yzui TaxID=2708254 RepID=A0A8J3LZW4_9MICO|nr:hypothetical protein [Pseudolysinimonas yzui]GHF14685.1 hypothetical protein GCM10011600_14540 [Pseudolysinimonas yzui]
MTRAFTAAAVVVPGAESVFIAQRELFAEQGAAFVGLLEVARLCEPRLPLLVEVVTRTVLPIASAGAERRSGFTVSADAWEFGGTIRVSELVLVGDSIDGLSRGENLLVRMLHGLAHVYNHWAGVKDTSNRERYHNARFARTASLLGLDVTRGDSLTGFVVTGISPVTATEYGPIIRALDQALVLTTPTGTDDPLAAAFDEMRTARVVTPKTSRYVFASCSCLGDRGAPRTIRIAVGSWQADSIHCSLCGTPFRAPGGESLTTPGQNPADGGLERLPAVGRVEARRGPP